MYKDITFINTDSSGINAINQSIKNILVTPRGSVPGNPRFGSDLFKLSFSNMNHLVESIAKNYIVEALTEFENRIDVEAIELELAEEFNKIVIDILFNYKNNISSDGQSNSTSISIPL
jgi:phage baseplate assembly protein W